MNIASLFHQAAGIAPDHAALIRDGESVSFGELQRQILDTAAGFAGRGIGPGSKVLVFVPTSFHLYRVVLALFHLGACPVFLDEWVSTSRLKACLAVVPPDALVATPKLRFLALFLAPLRRIKIKLPLRTPGNPGMPPLAEANENDTALITFTTGSTGIPKAANRTHGFLKAQYDALQDYLADCQEPLLTLLPVVALLNLGSGKTTRLPPAGFTAKSPGAALIPAVSNDNSKSIIGSPAQLVELAASGTFGGVTSVRTGGGPLWPDEAQKLINAFPAADIQVLYGSTEAEPIASIAAADLAATDLKTLYRYGLPVGKGSAAAQIAVIPITSEPVSVPDEEAWDKMILPPEMEGEIVVAGAHVLKHYVGNPVAEARQKIRVGSYVWHRTGELVFQHKNGNLFLRGRLEDVTLKTATGLSPLLAAKLFCLQTGARDAALVRDGDSTALAVVTGDGFRREAVENVLSELGLAHVPVQVVKAIPKDPRHRTKTDVVKLKQMVFGR